MIFLNHALPNLLNSTNDYREIGDVVVTIKREDAKIVDQCDRHGANKDRSVQQAFSGSEDQRCGASLKYASHHIGPGIHHITSGKDKDQRNRQEDGENSEPRDERLFLCQMTRVHSEVERQQEQVRTESKQANPSDFLRLFVNRNFVLIARRHYQSQKRIEIEEAIDRI